MLLILLAVSSLSLTACSEKKPAAKTDSQIAVKVNGEPIMAAEFGFSPGLGEIAPMLKSVSASDMKLMVDLELLRQAAIESKLDQDKEILARLAESSRTLPMMRPRIYPRRPWPWPMSTSSCLPIPAPAEAEVAAFYNEQSGTIRERKHYELQACAIKPAAGKEAKIKARLGKTKKFDDFERWLKANKIKHAMRAGVGVDSA